MQGDDMYMAYLKAQDTLNETGEVIASLERLAKFLNEEGWYTKVNTVDRAITKIKELKGKVP
jgi:hypothetical protein